MTPPAAITIAPGDLAALCPTYLTLDERLRISAAGPGIARILSEPPEGREFWEVFQSETPLDLRACAASGQVIKVRGRTGGASLRGLIITVAGGYLLFATPNVADMSEVLAAGLHLADFGALDPGLTHAFDLQLRAQMLSEVEELVADQTTRDRENRALVASLAERTRALERARADLELQNAVATTLAATHSLGQAAGDLLGLICARVNCSFASVWDADADKRRSYCIHTWHGGDPALADIAQAMLRLPQGDADAYRLFANTHRRPVWRLKLPRHGPPQAIDTLLAHGLTYAMLLPLIVAGEVDSVLTLHFDRPPPRDAGTLAALRGAVGKIEQFVERERHTTHIRRLMRIQAVLSGINNLIVRVSTREELFDGACKIAVEAGRFLAAGIGLVDPATAVLSIPSWAHRYQPTDQSWPDVSLGAPSTILRQHIAQAVREQRPVVQNITPYDQDPELWATPRDIGARAWAVFPLIVDGRAIGVFGIFVDESGFFSDEELRLGSEMASDIAYCLKHLNRRDELAYLAGHDRLTGLPNRRLFSERLDQAIVAASSRSERLAVVISDFRHFSRVNEAFGREGGDRVLREAAARMVRLVGGDNDLARIGPDRFALMIRRVRSGGAIPKLFDAAMTRWRAQPIMVDGREAPLSPALGMAMYPSDGADGETLLRNAEAALRKAKAAGEAFVSYAPALNSAVGDVLALEHELTMGLANNRYFLDYQPKIDSRTLAISGVEALIRWRAPDGATLPPARFIPMLEETGLIAAVGMWVLGQAIRDQFRWSSAGLDSPRVAINVSGVQLRRQDFVANVRRELDRFTAEYPDAPAPRIDIEITESTILQNFEEKIEELLALRELGFSIAIDDFGTGYSSLNYLARLPVQALKIDQSFVSTMITSAENLSIVSMIISLAHALSLEVIAEGVETEQQADMLRGLQCDVLQGYLFGRPVSSDRLAERLAGPGG